MRASKQLLCVLPLLMAGACALAPRYQLPPTPVPVQFGDASWQAAAPADGLQRGPWWTRFEDPQLTDLEARLEKDSPDLAAAEARYAAARSLAVEASAGLFPYVGAGAQATHNRQSDTRPLRSASQPALYHDYALGTAASYELDLWGRVRSLATIGRASAQASAADLAAVRLSLQAELAVDYLTLRGIDTELKLQADTTESYRRAAELMRTRREGGVASGLDLARAETQLSSAAAQFTDLTARRALYEHAIARLVGDAPPDFKLAPQPTLAVIPAVPLGVPSTLVERRPDVAAAERRVAAANAAIGVARAAYFPRVVLNAAGGFESANGAGWLTVPNRYWAIGPAAAVALFDAGSRHAEVSRARSTFEEAAERYRGTVLSAFQEVADNLSLVGLLQEESLQQADAARSAERALSLANTRYTEGAVSYLDVVVAQTAALQAQRAELSLQVRQLVASVGLVRALGGGWSLEQLPAMNQVATAKPTRTVAGP